MAPREYSIRPASRKVPAATVIPARRTPKILATSSWVKEMVGFHTLGSRQQPLEFRLGGIVHFMQATCTVYATFLF